MALRYKSKMHLTEKEVRYAMKHSTSNREAAAFLGISSPTYKKYAVTFIDPDTGKSLYEMHKRVSSKGMTRQPRRTRVMVKSRYQGVEGLLRILDGEFPGYKNIKGLLQRMIDEGLEAPRCGQCGFDEARITDDTVPLVLHAKDGDLTNLRRENLIALCYNCYYLSVGDYNIAKKGQVKKHEQ